MLYSRPYQSPFLLALSLCARGLEQWPKTQYAPNRQYIIHDRCAKENGMNYEKGQLYQIPLSDLQPDPNQPRKFMDPQALDDLSASITTHGVLTPILFRTAPPPEGATSETPHRIGS